MPKLSTAGAIIITIVVFLVVIGISISVMALKSKWRLRQKEKKLTRLLSGQSLGTVLAEAPYEFGHFQGEDGYRIYDKRKTDTDGFMGFATSTLDAHLWIVEQYLAEKDDKARNN